MERSGRNYLKSSLSAVRYVPQVLSRVANFLPICDRVAFKNVELFESVAETSIISLLAASKNSCYLIDMNRYLVDLKSVCGDSVRSKASGASGDIAAGFEHYKQFMFDLIEENCEFSGKIVAFYVNVDDKNLNDVELARMNSVASKTCELHSETVERFGFADFALEANRLTNEQCRFFNPEPPKQCGVSIYANITQWIKNLPRLSVLCLPSMYANDEYRNRHMFSKRAVVEKLTLERQEVWNQFYAAANGVREIHYYANSDAIDESMADILVQPFEQVKLVTFSRIKVDSFNKDGNFAVQINGDPDSDKLRLMFPRAMIAARELVIQICLVSKFGGVDELGRASGQRAMENILRMIEAAAARRLQVITFQFDSDVVQELVWLDLLPLFDRVLACLRRTTCGRIELSATSDRYGTWENKRQVFDHWCQIRKRHRGSCHVIIEKYSPDRIPENLKIMWFSRASEQQGLKADATYADAYFADICERRFAWLKASFLYEAPYDNDDDGRASDGCYDSCGS